MQSRQILWNRCCTAQLLSGPSRRQRKCRRRVVQEVLGLLLVQPRNHPKVLEQLMLSKMKSNWVESKIGKTARRRDGYAHLNRLALNFQLDARTGIRTQNPEREHAFQACALPFGHPGTRPQFGSPAHKDFPSRSGGRLAPLPAHHTDMSRFARRFAPRGSLRSRLSPAHGSLRSPADRSSAEPSLASLARTPFAVRGAPDDRAPQSPFARSEVSLRSTSR